MGGVIAYGDDDWFVANYEFQQLLGAASAKIEPDENRQLLRQAEALQGLCLDELGDEQRRRVVAAAAELAEADTSPRDDREAAFRSRLAELRTTGPSSRVRFIFPARSSRPRRRGAIALRDPATLVIPAWHLRL